MHRLHSDAVGDDIEIAVLPPAIPAPGPLPVVYCTDGNVFYGIAANTLNLLQLGAEIPPVRLVCVGYSLPEDATGFADFQRLRTRDFSPTPDAAQERRASTFSGREVRGCGGEAFLRFLTAELHPWVEANYAVTEDSTLIGDAMGGLFAT